MPNGVYALYHADGQLRFLCRVVSAQVDCWLNLSADGRSGHFDGGNTGEAYYADGRMETFSPWDDSPPFRAPVTFAEWRERMVAIVSRPVPASAAQAEELDLADFRASCARNFKTRPGKLTAEDWRMRFLGFLRRCHFAMHGCFDDLPSWRELVVVKGRVPLAWQRLLIEELPLCAAAKPGLWKADWTGCFAWRLQDPGWFLPTVARFEPQLDELAILSRLAAGVGPAAPEPVCRLRGLIFACELLCHLGEATSALGLARSLAPDLAFQPELAPWRQHPEELETWRMDWANTAELEEATRGHRAQLKAILERAGLQNCG